LGLQEAQAVNKQQQQRLWNALWLWNTSVVMFYGQRVLFDLLKRRPAFSQENTLDALISGTIFVVLVSGARWWNGRKNLR